MKKTLNLLFKYFQIFLVLVLFSSCQKNEKLNNDYVIKYNKKQLIEVGKILYNKKCLECHGNINANGNIIKNNYYDFDFFKYYLTKQDSLINIGHKETLKLKQTYKNNKYIHDFNLNNNELKSLKIYIDK